MSKKNDLFDDDIQTGNENDFEALLNQSFGAGRTLRTGDSITGEILAIGKEEAFVSTGTPVDGTIPLRELLDDKKQLKYKVGDRIDLKVVRAREGEILLRRANSTAASEDLESLEDAYDMELPVEGRVTEQVKGGYRVQVQNKMAFCPISQMDLRGGGDPAEYIGKKYEFIITQFENGRNVVVSRRRLLELKRAENEGEFINRHKIGDILPGKITRLEKYGAFVLLNDGVEGLIPISELAWGRISNPSEVVHIGQEVSVSLLRVLEEGDRLKVSLSLKQAGGEGDPWMRVPQNFPVGSVHEGTIERKEAYGLFVTLAPGVTGLLPRSKWRDSLDAQQFENRKKGEKIKVQVDEIRFEEHKLTLAPPSEKGDESWRSHTTAASGFGTFGDLLKGFKPGR